MRKETFVEGEYYHIYNRGVDKRLVFIDDSDRLRFVNTLYVLNNFLTIPDRFDVISLKSQEFLTPIKPYVEIVAGCLMPNHFHLMLSPLQKDGVSKFLHKFGVSYSMCFNKRHERTGRLFEGPFKAKHVDRDEYAVYLTQYIHLNPAELFQGKMNEEEVLRKIEGYEWSTLPDYLDQKSSFSRLLTHSFRDEVLDMNKTEYQKFLHDICKERRTP